jgi:hypothetical protein
MQFGMKILFEEMEVKIFFDKFKDLTHCSVDEILTRGENPEEQEEQPRIL